MPMCKINAPLVKIFKIMLACLQSHWMHVQAGVVCVCGSCTCVRVTIAKMKE